MDFRLPPVSKAVFALAALSLVLFFSCSRTAPKISFGFLSLVYFQGEKGPLERFSFFVIPEDEDGIENLDELYLYHDKEQLRWYLTSEDWVKYTYSGKTWIGSRSIARTDDGSLPRGQYRAVLINKGGEKSERIFMFDAPDEARFPFPKLNIADGRYTVASAYPENRLVCYDGEGRYISTVDLSGLSGVVSDLNIPQNARTAALWAEDAMYFTSALTDVVSLQ